MNLKSPSRYSQHTRKSLTFIKHEHSNSDNFCIVKLFMNEWVKQMSNHCSIYQKFNEIPSSRDRPDVVEMNPLHYVRIE